MPDDTWARCPTLRTRQESTRVYEPKVRYPNSNVGNLHTVLGLVHLFLPTGISFAFPLLPVSPPHPTIEEAPSPLAALIGLPTAATPFV